MIKIVVQFNISADILTPFAVYDIINENLWNGDVMIKLLIFDLDGTLSDTLPSIRHAINLAAASAGYPERTYDEVRAAIGDGARLLMKRVMPPECACDERAVDEYLSLYEDMYDKTYMEADTLYDGMADALDGLYERGYAIAVLSNKQDNYVKLIVEQIVKEGIVSLAMGQQEGYPTKPDPSVPLMIAERFGVLPSEVAFIGDSEVDVMTAKNAGMMSVGCDWGYRGREVLECHGADHVISRPEELLEIFL